jgi:hypothetical protein
MNKLLCVAIAAIFPLAGCATAPTAPAVAAASTASGPMMFCWKGRLTGDGGKMSCNWESSKEEACKSASFTTLEGGRYSEPQAAGMCSNGQWLVAVQSK